MSTQHLEILIRSASKIELPLIFELDKDAFNPDHYPLFVLRQLHDVFPDLFFVAVDHRNKILGYCFGGLKHDESQTGWIFALAVIKSARNQNIGQRLTTTLIDTFKTKQISNIQLTTTPDNAIAIRLYKSLGFKTLKEDANYYFDQSPRIIMQLKSKS